MFPGFLATASSVVMLPWRWFWSWMYPPPEFPLPPIPILGHLPYVFFTVLATFRLDKAVALMAKFAGFPAFKVRMGRLPGVFLNDVDSVKEVLENECCNSRPYTTFAHVFFTDSITMSSGKRWKTLKPLTVRALEEFGTARPEFNDMLNEDVKKLLRIVAPVRRHDGPERSTEMTHVADFRHYFYALGTSSVIWTVMRKRVDLASKEFEKFNTTVVEILGKGGYVAAYDLFPPFIMGLLPDFLTGLTKARKMRDVVHGFLFPMIQSELKTRNPGKPRHVLDLFVDELLSPTEKNFDEATIRREILPSVTDMVCSAESLGSSLGWCLQYLAGNPFDQKKVQDEIDALGLRPDDLPSYEEHRSRMPYTLAAMHEAVRLGCAAAMSFPHYAADTDCNFKNLTIKKGTIVLANLYAAHRDPKYFPKPEEFEPSRFLESSEKGDKFKPVDAFLAFSTGQRQCAAQNFSWHVMFKTMCAILKSYDLTADRPKHVPKANIWLPFIRAPSSMRTMIRARHVEGPHGRAES